MQVNVTDLPERLAGRIHVADDGCWLWTGWRNDLGYGYTRIEGRDRPAHRVVYEVVAGVQLARGIDVDHLCKNPPCVNPAHLEAVSHRENILRGRAATKTSCKYGHDLTDPRNTYVRPNGRRYCSECNRIACRERYARRRAA